jgi:hypothetical protein
MPYRKKLCLKQMEIKILKKRKQRKRKKIQSQILNNLKNKKCHIMQLKFMITPIL